MYEKILALLVAKHGQARKDGLVQLARSLALQAADETEAQALVDKLTSDNVTNFIKDWRKDVDSEVSNSTKTFENTLKSKFDLVEKKTPATPASQLGDEAPAWAKSLIDQNKALTEEIAKIKTGSTTQTRKQVLEAKLAQAPEAMKSKLLKDFGRMNFESDEDFNSFVTETETDVAAFIQDNANKGLSGFPMPGTPAGNVGSKVQVEKEIEAWAEKTNPTKTN